MHFPVEVLRKGIKDLFEACVSKDTHLMEFEKGLSRALKYHHMDFVPQQSSDLGEGFENKNEYKQFISVYDNFLQFTWMLTYAVMCQHNCTCGYFNANNYNESIELIQSMRRALRIYNLALEMLVPGYMSKYMKASRGLIYSLPNPYNHRDIYTDKVDSATIFGCAYLMLHEYGHFYYGHEVSTPANELQSDEFAIKSLAGWINLQKDKSKCVQSAALGVSMTMVAAAYISPTLISIGHPDIDSRVKTLFEYIEKNMGEDISIDVYRLLLLETLNWMKWANIESPNFDRHITYKERLCFILNSSLSIYKTQFKI